MRHEFTRLAGSVFVPRPLFPCAYTPVSVEAASVSGMCVFRVSGPAGFAMSDGMLPDLYVDGVKAYKEIGAFAGRAIYSHGGKYIFRHPVMGIIMSGKFATPHAVFDAERDEWVGDGWHQGDYDESATLYPRGTLLNGGSPPGNVTLTYAFNGYHGAELHGEYSKVGDGIPGGGDVATFGEPYWESDAGKIFKRHFISGSPRYTGTTYADGVYIIGSKGAYSGWWEGDAPTPKSSWVFSFVKPPSSDAPALAGVTLRWGGWAAGVTRVPGGIGTAIVSV